MSDSTRNPRALLDRARGARPDEATRRRIRAGLDAKLALIAATGVAAGTAAVGTTAAAEGATASVAGAAGVAGVAKAGLFGASAKIGLALGFVAVTGAGVHTWLNASGPAAPSEVASVVESAAPIAVNEQAAPPAAIDTGAPTVSAESLASATAPIVTPPPGAGRRDAASIAAEVALLRKAQASLREGDGDASLKAIDALAAKHPDGAMREEREAARVLALCAAGRPDDARVEALRFLSRWPSSVQAPRVRSSCAFAPKKP